MIAMSAAQLARAVNGELAGVPDPESVTVTSVTTDSREVTDGALFVAKPGETTDGHRFVPAAADSGAVLHLTERVVTDDAGAPYPCVVVADVVLAMGALASHVLEQLRAAHPVTGVEPFAVRAQLRVEQRLEIRHGHFFIAHVSLRKK